MHHLYGAPLHRIATGSILVLLLATPLHADEASRTASMSGKTVAALNELRLTKAQADALAPLIRSAVGSIHKMLDRESLLALSYPDQEMVFRKARVIFNRLDPQVSAVLREDQWAAYQRFKRFAVRRICSASYEIRGRSDGPGVMLDVIPE